VANDNRGIGTMFGPDATQQFLQTNGRRSHSSISAQL
jgi:hypothetical protein